jgi:hypothetical protein
MNKKSARPGKEASSILKGYHSWQPFLKLSNCLIDLPSEPTLPALNVGADKLFV